MFLFILNLIFCFLLLSFSALPLSERKDGLDEELRLMRNIVTEVSSLTSDLSFQRLNDMERLVNSVNELRFYESQISCETHIKTIQMNLFKLQATLQPCACPVKSTQDDDIISTIPVHPDHSSLDVDLLSTVHSLAVESLSGSSSLPTPTPSTITTLFSSSGVPDFSRSSIPQEPPVTPASTDTPTSTTSSPSSSPTTSPSSGPSSGPGSSPGSGPGSSPDSLPSLSSSPGTSFSFTTSTAIPTSASSVPITHQPLTPNIDLYLPWALRLTQTTDKPSFRIQRSTNFDSSEIDTKFYLRTYNLTSLCAQLNDISNFYPNLFPHSRTNIYFYHLTYIVRTTTCRSYMDIIEERSSYLSGEKRFFEIVDRIFQKLKYLHLNLATIAAQLDVLVN